MIMQCFRKTIHPFWEFIYKQKNLFGQHRQSFATGVMSIVIALSLVGCGGSKSDNGIVTIAQANQAPIAAAEVPQIIDELTNITLDASASTDPDGSVSSYVWRQLAGPPVTFAEGTAGKITLVTPEISADQTMTFELSLTDDQGAVTSRIFSFVVRNKAVVNDHGAVDTPSDVTNLIADAGTEQTLNESTLVQLQAAPRYNLDGTPVQYQWHQTTGPKVVLSDSQSRIPTFTAPVVTSDQILTFILTITDKTGKTAQASVKVIVKKKTPANPPQPPQQPPQVNAGPDQRVDEKQLVLLDAINSRDLDGTIKQYHWQQISGIKVNLAGIDEKRAAFISPDVTADTSLVFELTVTDNDGLVATDQVTISVQNVEEPVDPTPNPTTNKPPLAVAGADQNVNENDTVTLDGSASHDPDGDKLTYQWTQTAGPTITGLSGATTAKLQFAAPAISNQVILTFSLRVEDGKGGIATDTVTVVVNTVSDQGKKLLDSVKQQLHDPTVPYTTDTQFNQSDYAAHHLPDEEARRLQRTHELVAMAVDPDPDWFSTAIDKPVVVAKPGEKYTVNLTKQARDGSSLGPVDQAKLRLVVRIQHDKDTFEYVNNNDISQYVQWKGAGVLEIQVPASLTQGRLLVAIRPNFDDVATSAIAERWSGVMVAEVWPTKVGVISLDDSSVLFPQATASGIAADSEFTKAEIAQAVQAQLNQNALLLPLVVNKTTIAKSTLVAYVYQGQPYAGKVVSVTTRGKQALLLLSPELLNVYSITDADEKFMINQGLYPENLIFREGTPLAANPDESDPTQFSAKAAKATPASATKFFTEHCLNGTSVLTFKPTFSLAPADIGLDITVAGGPLDKVECTWEATTATVKLDNFIMASGGVGTVLMQLFGGGAELQGFGKIDITLEKLGPFGIEAGYSLVKGSHQKLLKSPVAQGSRDLTKLNADSKAEISGSVGGKVTLSLLNKSSSIRDILYLLGIKNEGSGIEASAEITTALTVDGLNAKQVYDKGESSAFSAALKGALNIEPKGYLLTLLQAWGIKLDVKQNLEKEIFNIKAEATHTFNDVNDDGKGKANLNGLSLQSGFLRKLLPESKGVLSGKEGSVFNDYSEAITYDTKACTAKNNFKITSPVIACAGWMCGQVDKPAELCKGQLSISDVVANAKVGTKATGKATITNKAASDLKVTLAGLRLIPEESSFSMQANSQKSVTFSTTCLSTPGTYRGRSTATATGVPEANATNILVCHKDDARGDPHLVTADGFGYDYYASGDYVLSRLPGVNGYEIQARFLPGYETSWPQAVAVQVGNDIVEVQGIQTTITGMVLNRLKIWINGEESTLGSAENYLVNLPGGGKLAVDKTVSRNIYQYPTGLTVIWPEGSATEAYGLILNVAESRDPFVLLQVARPTTFAGKERGLMGNNNGNPQDDLIRRNGQVLAQNHKLTFTELYALFGADWLVREYESLFRNPNAIKPAFPKGVITLTPQQRALGEEACRALTGFYKEACIMDVGLTGSTDLIKELYSNTEDLNKLSKDIVNPSVDLPVYTWQVDNRVELEGSTVGKLHYGQTVHIKKQTGEGNFIVRVQPPRGATATLDSGLQNFTGNGDTDLKVTVDCRTFNPATNNDLFLEIGKLQLWAQDPLSGTANQLYAQINLPCSTATSSLNDTGITTCSDIYSNHYLSCPVDELKGQDGEFGRDVTDANDADGHAGFSFTKISQSGQELPASATQWSCVKDNVTGLIWEVKTDDNTLHDKDWTYSWYEPDMTKNGGYPGELAKGSCGNTSQCDTYEFVKEVNRKGWCGFNNWRLPTYKELISIIDFSQTDNIIDQDYFPEFMNVGEDVFFWSSTRSNYGVGYVYIVSLRYGFSMSGYSGYPESVRLVRNVN